MKHFSTYPTVSYVITKILTSTDDDIYDVICLIDRLSINKPKPRWVRMKMGRFVSGDLPLWKVMIYEAAICDKITRKCMFQLWLVIKRFWIVMGRHPFLNSICYDTVVDRYNTMMDPYRTIRWWTDMNVRYDRIRRSTVRKDRYDTIRWWTDIMGRYNTILLWRTDTRRWWTDTVRWWTDTLRRFQIQYDTIQVRYWKVIALFIAIDTLIIAHGLHCGFAVQAFTS